MQITYKKNYSNANLPHFHHLSQLLTHAVYINKYKFSETIKEKTHSQLQERERERERETYLQEGKRKKSAGSEERQWKGGYQNLFI